MQCFPRTVSSYITSHPSILIFIIVPANTHPVSIQSTYSTYEIHKKQFKYFLLNSFRLSYIYFLMQLTLHIGTQSIIRGYILYFCILDSGRRACCGGTARMHIQYYTHSVSREYYYYCTYGILLLCVQQRYSKYKRYEKKKGATRCIIYCGV